MASGLLYWDAEFQGLSCRCSQEALPRGGWDCGGFAVGSVVMGRDGDGRSQNSSEVGTGCGCNCGLERRRSHVKVEQHFHFLHLHFAPVLLMSAGKANELENWEALSSELEPKTFTCFVPCCT